MGGHLGQALGSGLGLAGLASVVCHQKSHENCSVGDAPGAVFSYSVRVGMLVLEHISQLPHACCLEMARQ